MANTIVGIAYLTRAGKLGLEIIDSQEDYFALVDIFRELTPKEDYIYIDKLTITSNYVNPDILSQMIDTDVHRLREMDLSYASDDLSDIVNPVSNLRELVGKLKGFEAKGNESITEEDQGEDQDEDEEHYEEEDDDDNVDVEDGYYQEGSQVVDDYVFAVGIKDGEMFLILTAKMTWEIFGVYDDNKFVPEFAKEAGLVMVKPSVYKANESTTINKAASTLMEFGVKRDQTLTRR